MKCIISWQSRLTIPLFCAVSSFLAQTANAEELFPSAFGVLAEYDVVIVGELHDNQAHHDNQAAIAREISPSALVFEMLSAEQAKGGRGVPRFDQNTLDQALGWSEGAWSNFEMYFPIFRAHLDAEIYGAALDRNIMRSSVTDGAAAQFEGNIALYGLDQRLDSAEQMKREALQMEAHCNALPETMLPGMVEAQRLRDAHFSKVTLQALKETGGPVLVITGNGHARTDWAMPRFLNRAAPEVKVVSVGQLLQEADTPPYDRWIVTGDYTPLDGDPCAAFK